MEHILDTIHADNPWFKKIKLKELPRWICGYESVNTKKHLSLVLTLKSKSSQKELLNHRFIFGWDTLYTSKNTLTQSQPNNASNAGVSHTTQAHVIHNTNADNVEMPAMNMTTPVKLAK
jgi:hypothetical protein